jgi:hypothetical protein
VQWLSVTVSVCNHNYNVGGDVNLDDSDDSFLLYPSIIIEIYMRISMWEVLLINVGM